MSEEMVTVHRATIGSRVCQEPECSTVLSRYNEFDYCALHQPMVVPRMRGKVL